MFGRIRNISNYSEDEIYVRSGHELNWLHVRFCPFARYSANLIFDEQWSVKQKTMQKQILVQHPPTMDRGSYPCFYEVNILPIAKLNSKKQHDHSDDEQQKQLQPRNCNSNVKQQNVGNNRRITVCSFNSPKYNKKKAKVHNSALTIASERVIPNAHLFITSDNKYIIYFHHMFGYDVYDYDNDVWLVAQEKSKLMKQKHKKNLNNKRKKKKQKSNKKITFSAKKKAEKNDNHSDNDDQDDKYKMQGIVYAEDFSRSLMINDEIIIISEAKRIFFYYIGLKHKLEGDNCLIYPKCFGLYDILTKECDYRGHGMCLIEYEYNYDKHKNKCDYRFKLILFGSDVYNCSTPFIETIVQFDVKISINLKSVDEKKMIIFECNENKIKCKDIECYNFTVNEELQFFGYECVLNHKNQPIIMIIGGNDYEESISFYNVKKQKITKKDDVCCNTTLNCNILCFIRLFFGFFWFCFAIEPYSLCLLNVIDILL